MFRFLGSGLKFRVSCLSGLGSRVDGFRFSIWVEGRVDGPKLDVEELESLGLRAGTASGLLFLGCFAGIYMKLLY